jgi:hypothetical protein
MATIFASSDTAPLNSVIICCTTVTTLNMLSRGSLFIFWASTEWPAFLLLVQSVFLRVDLPLDLVPEPATVAAYCLERRKKRHNWGDDDWREHTSRGRFGCSLSSFSAAPPWRVCSPDNWRAGPSLPPPNDSYSMLVWKQPFSGHSLCRWPPQHHEQGVVDVPNLLAVMTLRKTSLGPYGPPHWWKCGKGLADWKFLATLPSWARL